MYRAPRFERGGCRRKSCRECQLKPMIFMLNPQAIRDKKLLSIHREIAELRQRYWLTVQLTEPIQRGWVRFYSVAEKIGNHRDREMLTEILKVIGTERWSKTPDFRRWKRRRKRKQFVDVEQPLAVISASRWERRQFPECWKAYFRIELVRHKTSWHPTYVFAHRGLFELTVKPLLVTELQVPDPEVQTRMAELEKYLTQKNLRPRLDWLLGNSPRRWSDDPRIKLRERITKAEMRTAFLSRPEVGPASSTGRIRISLLTMISPA